MSYFRGQPDSWITDVPTFDRIAYRNLWSDTDLEYAVSDHSLKYRLVVGAGADPERPRFTIRGAPSVRIGADGRMRVATPTGSIVDAAPIAYQEIEGKRVPVEVRYALERSSSGDATYGFRVGSYDSNYALVIDPTVMLSSGFIGGSQIDRGTDVAVDAAGYIYVTGHTQSSDGSFPALGGPDTSHNGTFDAWVAKLDPSATSIIYIGYIGGSSDDLGYGIDVDPAGAAYVFGSTRSGESSFPVLVGPELTYTGADSDAFVAKVTPSGTSLAYAGYIGGLGADTPSGDSSIAVDASGHAYIAGTTQATEGGGFPVVSGPDTTYNGGTADAFVSKVNPSGSGFVYSGYIGGGGFELGVGLDIDGAGNAYVFGRTDSNEATFPVAVGPDLSHNGGIDAFVAKVDAGGTSLDYAGYIGGKRNGALPGLGRRDRRGC